MVFSAKKCSLRREDCLIGRELQLRMEGMLLKPEGAVDVDDKLVATAATQSIVNKASDGSQFEYLLTVHPPILDVLLLHLPTRSIFDLYHTSSRLRQFFQAYPLAWKNLSFRRACSDPSPFPGADSPSPTSGKSHALDLLLRVTLPYATCITRLDLDNSTVSGSELYARILTNARGTLQHLSVRNCKYVSLKYHVLPFLCLEETSVKIPSQAPLALKSLYTFKCRHHRRRPYLRSSISRRDSDSQPTHQLVTLCHRLAIWTDTGWCTTPGPRCLRRKEYAHGRIAPDSNLEVWVPFDRLWRSQNFNGTYLESEPPLLDDSDGGGHLFAFNLPSNFEEYSEVRNRFCTWQQEHAYQGEPLGAGLEPGTDSKNVPTHLRKSHIKFIDGFRCYKCNEYIYERCETCSHRMHCVGCRKTLCASCAFDRPLPSRKKKQKDPKQSADDSSVWKIPDGASNEDPRHDKPPYKYPLWWAPGSIRSPNIINENLHSEDDSDDDSSDQDQSDTGQARRKPDPKITTRTCCPKIDFVDVYPPDVRAVPLPIGEGYEDPVFPSASDHIVEAGATAETGGVQNQVVDIEADGYPPHDPTQYPPLPPWDLQNGHSTLRAAKRTRKVGPFDMKSLLQNLVDMTDPAKGSPRNLCEPCYQSPNWKVQCAIKDCHNMLCIDHDVKSLRVRQCGSRRLKFEYLRLLNQTLNLSAKERSQNDKKAFFNKWKPIAHEMSQVLQRVSEAEAPVGIAITDSQCQVEEPEKNLLPYGEAEASSGKVREALALQSMPVSRCRSSSDPSTKAEFRSHNDHGLVNSTNREASRLIDYNGLHEDGPLFVGCRRLFCQAPTDRVVNDIRPSCVGWDYVLPCSSCSTVVCYDCCGLEMGCTCSACTLPINDPSKFICPACFGDWRIAKRVARKTESIVNDKGIWPKTKRRERFWRCRVEQESQIYAELTAEWRKRNNLDAIVALFDELPEFDSLYAASDSAATEMSE